MEAAGSAYLTFLDAVTGFNQIKNTRRAMEMLAIVARSGQFLPVCLTFGPHNGPEDFSLSNQLLPFLFFDPSRDPGILGPPFMSPAVTSAALPASPPCGSDEAGTDSTASAARATSQRPRIVAATVPLLSTRGLFGAFPLPSALLVPRRLPARAACCRAAPWQWRRT